MSRFITRLQEEHAELAAAVAGIRDSGHAHAASWLVLGRIRGRMLSHLMKEDRYLYPALLACASRHPVLREVVHRYQQDLDTVAGAAFAFFRKHDEHRELPDFATDLEHLCGRITERIRKEETLLYPTYAKLVAAGEITEPLEAATA